MTGSSTRIGNALCITRGWTWTASLMQVAAEMLPALEYLTVQVGARTHQTWYAVFAPITYHALHSTRSPQSAFCAPACVWLRTQLCTHVSFLMSLLHRPFHADRDNPIRIRRGVCICVCGGACVCVCVCMQLYAWFDGALTEELLSAALPLSDQRFVANFERLRLQSDQHSEAKWPFLGLTLRDKVHVAELVRLPRPDETSGATLWCCRLVIHRRCIEKVGHKHEHLMQAAC